MDTSAREDSPVAADGSSDLADSFAVPGFDAVARLAVASLNVSAVSLVLNSGAAYWFTTDPSASHAPTLLPPRYLEAARRGLPEVVLDTHADERFRHAPLLLGPNRTALRFFACEPVFTLNGRQVGALCVMDRAPHRALNDKERDALRDAASLAGAGVVLRSYIGRTDPVSQLPHRSAFFEDLRARQQSGARRAWLIAMDVAPIERLYAFVRAMGHAYADELTRAVAARIQAWMPSDTHLYQVGVSRFAAVLPDTPQLVGAAQLDDLVQRLRAPFDCLGIPLTIQPGVGLIQLDVRHLDGSDPLRMVMSASHAAQHHARGWAVYDRTQDEQHRHEFFLVTELAAALTERTELDLHYQPRVDLTSGRCVALEALARWHHPTLGNVPPAQFIGLAERAGLMPTLTEWVLDHGVAQLARWQQAGHAIGLSLNVSSADFGADLVDRVQAVTARHGVDPGTLELEFTESTLMQHSEANGRYLAALRAMNIGIAIDDFGTGYSNLSSLRQVPATCLKIDQSFVRSMDASRHDAAIVRSVADLAHDLGFRVVVEGVETQAVYDAVCGMPACDEVQGYYISRPMPAAAVVDCLDRMPVARTRTASTDD